MVHATGLIVLLGMLAAWVAVQRGWQRMFRAAGSDPDALSERTGCGGGSCHEPCDRRLGRRATGHGKEGR